MPVRALKFCAGKEKRPCRFSLSLAGGPRTVHLQNRCEFCRGSIDKLSGSLSKSLALLFVLDFDIYREALSTVNPSILAACRAKVGAILPRMIPPGVNTAKKIRHGRALVAIDILVQDVKIFPRTMSSLKAHARIMQNAALLKKRWPREVLINVLCLAMGDMPQVLTCCLRQTKQYAYSICRHPAFFHEDSDDDTPVPEIYSNSVGLHQRMLTSLRQALNRHIVLASTIGWSAYERNALDALGLVSSMASAPTLAPGKPLCHKHFQPQQMP